MQMVKSSGADLGIAHDGWLLTRYSGTEPKIRIAAEAKTRNRAKELYHLGTRALAEG